MYNLCFEFRSTWMVSFCVSCYLRFHVVLRFSHVYWALVLNLFGVLSKTLNCSLVWFARYLAYFAVQHFVSLRCAWSVQFLSTHPPWVLSVCRLHRDLTSLVRPRSVCLFQRGNNHWRFRCLVDDSPTRHEVIFFLIYMVVQ